MNQLLKRRNLPVLTIEKYRKIFTFPVKSYYQSAGFNFEKEPFELPALEFIDLYHQALGRAKLFSDVMQALEFISSKGISQSVLSAMEHESLVKSLIDQKIFPFFEEVSGINNHYAHSKLEIGQQLIEKINLPKNQLLMIGDSLHDLEVSDQLGIDCLLVSRGHQSKERLLAKTPNVFDELNDVISLFN
jgi:phosphoglycolate phosphatase